MSIGKKLAKSVPFAHLLGIRAEEETDDERKEREEEEARRADWAKKAEEDPDRKQREDESDDDYAKRMEKMDEDEEKDKASRARGDEEDGDSEEARAERARCAEIIAFGIRNDCIRNAAVFAFDTHMTAGVAIANLKATRGDGKQNLRERMQTVAPLKPLGQGGAESPDASSPAAIANAIILAGKKARGEA